ncbi:hypothetical protein AURDEDRAFT_167551 [Auricularia subglabra TFB-10046 SS5]|nr:hypothetical protein AURDEDRAFT_167551 [Auricularia subglabra TFB-10046 SS5]
MTDPYRNYPAYTPRYGSTQAPPGAAAQGHQAAPGQASHSPALPPVPESHKYEYHTGTVNYGQAYYPRTTEQGVFDMSPIPGEVPSPYHPGSQRGTPQTRPSPQARPSSQTHPSPNSPPVLRAPDKNAPSYSPPAYAPPNQDYYCDICRQYVRKDIANEHIGYHRRQTQQQARPPVGLGFNFFAHRGDNQDQGGSGSAESSGSAFYNPSSQTTTRR